MDEEEFTRRWVELVRLGLKFDWLIEYDGGYLLKNSEADNPAIMRSPV